MRRNEAKTALQAARDWNDRGLMQPGALDTIEQELQAKAAEPSLAMQSLYAIGGVLLGAATAAVWVLLMDLDLVSDSQPAGWLFFLMFAVLLLGAGIALHLNRQVELGDALLLAGLVPTAILLGPEPPWHDALSFTALAMALGILAFRHKAFLLPLVSLGLACVALPVFLFRIFPWNLFESNDVANWFWLLGALGMWAGLMLWNRFARPTWDDEGAAATTLALGIAWVAVVVEVLDINIDGLSEVVIAIGLGALIAIGVALKERGVIFTAGVGLTIDAIVFAFNVGGITVGLITLLGLSGALIALATIMRRRKASETSSSGGH